MELTKKISQLNKSSAEIAGGKGASLGEMINAKIPVPDGFVVLTNAFERFIEETGIHVEIDNIFYEVDPNAVHSLEKASSDIQHLIKSAEIPQDIADDIRSRFNELDTEYVAVRSSATAEDGKDHAWAGQLDSFLNTTKGNIPKRVQDCWASLFTPRAIFYRYEKELHTTKISVAVVVQKMVNSEKSGVAFSVHPVTETKNQLIIEAGFGLGEAIVSGQITPDSYVVEKTPRSILDINVTEQKKALCRQDGGGNIWKNLSKEEANNQVLSEDQIRNLSEIIINIENHYGFPCDIEWAFENNTFYIVQSRPITTLSNTEAQEEGSKNLLPAHRIHASHLVDTFSKMLGANDILVLRGSYSPNLIWISWAREDGVKDMYKSVLPYFALMKNNTTVAIADDTIYRQIAANTFEMYWNNKLTLAELEEDLNNRRKKIHALYITYNDEKLTGLSDIEFRNLALEVKDNTERHATETLFIEQFDQDTVLQVINENNKQLIDEVWEKSTDPSFGSFEIRRNKIILESLKNSSLYEAVQKTAFIYTDYWMPKSYAEIRDVLSKIDILDLEQERRKQQEEVRHKKQDFNIWYKSLNSDQKKFADYTQYIMRMRDERKDTIGKYQYLLYLLSKEACKRINFNENLSYLLSAYDLSKGIDYLMSIKHDLEKRVNGVCAISGQDLFEICACDFDATYSELEEKIKGLKIEGADEIKGAVACKGIVKGRIKIILNPKIENFKEGDILVTGMTRPEYLSMMKKAIAVITDEGGITCHAAIVSRELGIPCITGTKNATKVFKDGELVEVDADNGIVRKIKTAPHKV